MATTTKRRWELTSDVGTYRHGAAVGGDLATAWAYNPASLVLVGAAIAVVVRSMTGVATGHWINVRVSMTRRGWLVLAIAVLALEINQQAHAALLMASGG